jgi:hypothetical protein
LGGAVYPPVNPLGGGLQGFEWTVLKLGGDLRVTRSVAFGPFAGLSLGQYLTASEAYKDGNYLPPGNIAGKAAHFWLTLGISGAYDFGF